MSYLRIKIRCNVITNGWFILDGLGEEHAGKRNSLIEMEGWSVLPEKDWR